MDFQEFLKELDEDYYDELVSFLREGHGCGDNKNKMMEIYNKVKNDGKEQFIIDFLSKRYPHMIVKSGKIKEEIIKPNSVEKIGAVSAQDANYHKVFPLFKPGMLMLPQQKIFVAYTEKEVYDVTMHFISNKLSTNFVLLKGPKYWHSYIEYFDIKYKNDIDKVPKHKRPVWVYKKEHNIK
jgi:hypothetical protein